MPTNPIVKTDETHKKISLSLNIQWRFTKTKSSDLLISYLVLKIQNHESNWHEGRENNNSVCQIYEEARETSVKRDLSFLFNSIQLGLIWLANSFIKIVSALVVFHVLELN